MSQDQKFALVTGASSGIGKATAKELASRGYKVFACARRLELMNDLIKYDIEPICLDVTDASNVQEVKKIIDAKTGGKLHILFNNAGLSCTMPALDVTDEMAKDCFEVNVLAPVRLTREFAPLVIKTKGCIAFTGSLAGVVPFPLASIYGATKLAIHQYVRSLHLEMKPFEVKVLNIVTGGVDTNIADVRPLPESSLYYSDSFLDSFERRQKMAKLNLPMSAEVYAAKICNDMIGSRDPINVYRGSKASWLSLVVALVPPRILEFFLIRAFKLTEPFAILKRKLQKEHSE